jgi:purine-nucleoside phosphorylase
VPHHVGLVWTSDAFYREGEDIVAPMRAAKIQSVEMEASVIFLLAQLKGGRGGVVLAVSDNLARGQKKAPVRPAEGPAEHSPRIRRALHRATQVALDAIVRVHHKEHQGAQRRRRQES